jgi:hypothetical protein
MSDNLPPLPETVYGLFYEAQASDDDEGYQELLDEPAYTADQMRTYARAAIEANTPAAPELCDPSCSTYDLASMILSDCGHSTNNQRLLDRVAARIDKRLAAMLAASHQPQPVQRGEVAWLDDWSPAPQPQPVAQPLDPWSVEEDYFAWVTTSATTWDAFLAGVRLAENAHSIKPTNQHKE